MQVRRIVTGHGSDGKSIFISDAAAPRSNDVQACARLRHHAVMGDAPGAWVPAAEGRPAVAARSWSRRRVART